MHQGAAAAAAAEAAAAERRGSGDDGDSHRVHSSSTAALSLLPSPSGQAPAALTGAAPQRSGRNLYAPQSPAAAAAAVAAAAAAAAPRADEAHAEAILGELQTVSDALDALLDDAAAPGQPAAPRPAQHAAAVAPGAAPEQAAWESSSAASDGGRRRDPLIGRALDALEQLLYEQPDAVLAALAAGSAGGGSAQQSPLRPALAQTEPGSEEHAAALAALRSAVDAHRRQHERQE